MWPSIAAASWPPTSHWYRPCSASSRARRRALRPPPFDAPESLGCKGLLVLFRVGGIALAVLIEGEHQVGHFHRDAGGVAALLGHARLSLLVRVGGQDRVGDGHAVVHRGPRHAARGLLGHDLEVVRLAADDASDRD